MTVPEDITVALMIVVGVLTTVSLYIGLFGMLNRLSVVQHNSRRHATLSASQEPRSMRHRAPHPPR